MKKEFIPIWENEGPDICRFCAFAKRNEKQQTVYCEKRKKEFPEDKTCRKFKYDILKKDLRRMKRPEKARVPFEV